MKKDVGHYFRRAWKDTRLGFKKLGIKQRALLFIYIIASFLGKIFFFTRPIFTVADENLAELLKKREPFSFWNIFGGTLRTEQYRALSLTYLIADLMIFVGLIAIIILPLLMWTLLVPAINNRFYLLGFYYALTIFFIALGVLYVLTSLIYYVPIAFVSRRQTVPEPGVLLKTVNQGLRQQGKINIFFLNFLYLILFVIAIGLIIIQGQTAFFSFLVTVLGYRGFGPTFIFSIVFLVFNFLFLIYLVPFFYGHLQLTQNLILTDTMDLSTTPVAPVVDQLPQETTSEQPPVSDAPASTPVISQETKVAQDPIPEKKSKKKTK
jgi:hypothetical protein